MKNINYVKGNISFKKKINQLNKNPFYKYLLNIPWDFFGRNDDKAETPVLWPPHAKS